MLGYMTKKYFIYPHYTKELRSLLKCVNASKIELEFRVLVFVEGGKPENLKKNPPGKDENQQQTQPTYGTEPKSNRRPHWWEASALIATSPHKPCSPCGSLQLLTEPQEKVSLITRKEDLPSFACNCKIIYLLFWQHSVT